MKRILLFILIASVGSLMTLVGCMNHEDAMANAEKPIDKTAVSDNAKALFGTIDSRQDWSSINQGSVTITADANLDDIVKVQILTESPFGNPDATVLNEAEVKNGGKVTLVYDAPNVCDQLVAACVNSKGVYFVKVFDLNDKAVSFSSSAAARMTRADASGFPTPSNIVLGEPIKSFNALRAEASLSSESHTAQVYDKAYKQSEGKKGGKERFYEVWNDGSWASDRLWSVVSFTDGEWKVEDGTVYKTLTASEDLTTVKTIVETYLQKTGGLHQTNGKRNNWESIAEGNEYFNDATKSNYVVSNGTPVTIIPIQMNTTEGAYNSIYYYYFNPQATAGMSSAEEANYIKALPKYKVINGTYNAKFKREKEYLLPYFGDGVPSVGAKAVSCTIPKGYKIGFLNRKNFEGNDNPEHCANGCVYGDGRLNVEVNHLMGHFFSAINKTIFQMVAAGSPTNSKDKRYGNTENGMNWDSPRIGVFSANDRTYMCFEDGADCNFSDMIIEIVQGTEIVNEEPAPEAAGYTMCFEDDPESADYDMNDIVLQARRVNETHIQLSIVALGGYDEVILQGIDGPLASAELHQLFGLTAGQKFVNTEKNGLFLNPVSWTYTVDKNIRIEDFLKKIKVKNLTTGQTIGVPEPGEPPYAVIVPIYFKYPLEKQSITAAYEEFANWARNMNNSIDWYLLEDVSKVYEDIVNLTNR